MRFQSLARHHWQQLDGLNTVGLEAVFLYSDAQSDDVALTHAVMRSATDLGAKLMLSAAVRQIKLTAEESIVRYAQSGIESECLARVIVNATGPWTNSVLSRVTPKQLPFKYDLVQGTHIVVPSKPNAGIYYVEAPQDGRAVFIMPWKGRTMVGTTELIYTGAPDSITPTNAEIEYLLQTLRYYFPRLGYGLDDVLEAFAGVRVLPTGDNTASARPRETLLVTDQKRNPRLISILGGKLTAYRATAEKTIRRVASSLPAPKHSSDTANISLIGDDSYSH
jgi:glycerol-3-phosphate dehydrogenase